MGLLNKPFLYDWKPWEWFKNKKLPYELKPRDVERRFFTCEQLIQRQQRKGFLHRIVNGDEKGYSTTTPRRKNTTLSGQSLPSISTSTSRPNIHVLYLVGPKGSCLLWVAETWRFHYGRSISATIDSFEPFLWIKRPEYEQRHDKVILLHARPHVAKVVKKYLKTLKCFTHPPYSPDIAPSFWLLVVPKNAASHRFTSFAEIENWIASKDELFFRDGIRKLPERWEKVLGVQLCFRRFPIDGFSSK